MKSQWEVPSGRERLRQVRPGAVYAVHASPDERRLASGDAAGNLNIWETRAGDKVAQMLHQHKLNALAFSGHGRTIATADDRGYLHFWKPDGSLLVGDVKPPVWKTERLKFTPDDAKVIGAYTARSYLIDAPSGNNGTLLIDWRNTSDLAISPTFVVRRTSEREIQVFAFDQVNEVKRFRPADDVYAIRLSQSGHFLLTRHRSGSISVYSLPEAKRLIRILPEYAHAEHMAISQEGRIVAIAAENEVEIWDLATATQRMFLISSQEIRGLWFSPAGDTLVVLTFDSVALYDMNTGRCRARLQHQGEIRAHSLGVGGALR